MSILYIISVPIGNERDIAMNAIEKLQQADLIIGEEHKETSKLLKLNGIDKEFELLNCCKPFCSIPGLFFIIS